MQLQVNVDYPMIFNTIKLKLTRKQYKSFCLQKYFPLTFFFTELINNDWRSGMALLSSNILRYNQKIIHEVSEGGGGATAIKFCTIWNGTTNC